MSDPADTPTTADEYRDILVWWLQNKEREWHHTARTGTGAAADAASFYAAAYGSVASEVQLGQPERLARLSSKVNAMSDWRPIDTAPKDGTVIDLFGTDYLSRPRPGGRTAAGASTGTTTRMATGNSSMPRCRIASCE